jgi:hypothetical protein
MIIGTVLGGVQFLISTFIADKDFKIPLWIWIGCILLGFLVANFLAFHKIRLERDSFKDKMMIRQPTKTETLYEQRTSHFYDVVTTLEQMGEKIDEICESVKGIDKKILPDLLNDVTKILRTNTVVTKIIKIREFKSQQFRALNKATYRKWGELKSNDLQTITFIQQLSGIYNHYKVGVLNLSRKNRDYRRLEKLLSSQRLLVLCDGTYN